MQIYFSNDITNNTAFFTEEESMHLTKVMRMRKGQKVQVVDGKGGLFEAEITEDSPRKAAARIIKQISQTEPRNFYIHLAIAPTKNSDRIEWLVEKAIEMGVDEISFIVGKNSERDTLKMERVERIALSAMKQSLKTSYPAIHEPVKLKDFLNQDFSNYQTKAIAYIDDAVTGHLLKAAAPKSKYLVLIGPEGDFNAEEVTLAKSKGFTPVSLGPSRLRTETAGMAVVNMLNTLNID